MKNKTELNFNVAIVLTYKGRLGMVDWYYIVYNVKKPVYNSHTYFHVYKSGLYEPT